VCLYVDSTETNYLCLSLARDHVCLSVTLSLCLSVRCKEFCDLLRRSEQKKQPISTGAGRMKVAGDWSYIYFLVPSVFSFLFSCAVIYKVTSNQQNLKKKFHQLTLLIAVFDFIQCVSWFFGPRYETETTLCLAQEYMFQLGSFGQGITAVIICTTISKAIQFGKVPTWKNKEIIPWVLSLPICLTLSVSFNTATMFCPFNKHHELYHPNLTHNSPVLKHLVCYILCYLFPLLMCVISTLWYTIRSMYTAYRKSDRAIYQVAQQLRLYPLMLAICMSPIVSYFISVIITGEESHPLLFLGAILASSSGIINGWVYFHIIRNSKERSYSTHHFRGEVTSSFLMTEHSVRSPAKSKSKTASGALSPRTDEDSSFGYYDASDRGSSAVSENQLADTYDDDLSECNAAIVCPFSPPAPV
jgi:hypothetical protein